jgi:hypothetical protein
MKTLYDGTQVPETININQRIFRVFTFDGETVLCNADTAKLLLPQTKRLQHYWNDKFESFSKLELKEM